MRTLVAALILAPISWIQVVRHIGNAGSNASEETCDSTFQVTLWTVVGIISTLILITNWQDL